MPKRKLLKISIIHSMTGGDLEGVQLKHQSLVTTCMVESTVEEKNGMYEKKVKRMVKKSCP